MFKKNDELITPVDVSIESNEIGSIAPTDAVTKATNASEPFMEIISSIVDPTSNNEVEAGGGATTEGAQIMIIERKDLEKTVTRQSLVPDELNIRTAAEGKKSELRAKAEDVTVFSNEIPDKEERLNLSNGGVLEGSIFETFHFDEDDDKNDSDDSDEDYRLEVTKLPRPTEYSSRQRSLPSSTLLHGFLANPGYPSFYIGKTNDCKWKLTLSEGQSIALTILDLHLRSKEIGTHFFVHPSYRLSSFPVDDFCKDSLEIIDVLSRKTLYRGCSELSRPIQVQSSTNSVEVRSPEFSSFTFMSQNFSFLSFLPPFQIVLRTKSRSIYPKRGFLIHYKGRAAHLIRFLRSLRVNSD